MDLPRFVITTSFPLLTVSRIEAALFLSSFAVAVSSSSENPQVVPKQFPNQFQNNSPVRFKTIPHFFDNAAIR